MKMYKNVVIFSLDCVRREALDCYPQRFPWRVRVLSKAETPTIDKLCNGGVRFDQAITHAPFTPAAHASLLTGLIPPNHGVRKFLGSKLHENATTLAEVLSAAGWQCGAVVSAYSLSGKFGFKRGFQHFSVMSDDDWDNRVQRSAGEVTELTLSWLDSIKQDRPFFLFVHYFDAHNIPAFILSQTPDTSSMPTVHRTRHTIRDALPKPIRLASKWVYQNLRNLYFAALKLEHSVSDWFLGYFEAGRNYLYQGRRFMLKRTAEIDTQVGRIIRWLADQNKLDDTLIILLADHGDDFWEHGEPTHRQFLYDTTLIVPLIIHPKTGKRDIVGDQVRLVDIFPTVLGLLGLDNPINIDGESLLPLLDKIDQREMLSDSRKAYSETLYEIKENEASNGEIKKCYASLREYPWKFIWDRMTGSYELYRVDQDPHELENLIEDHPELAQKLSAELHQLAQEMPVETGLVDDLMVERLKALGYL